MATKKNSAAVALSRLGASKGGHARAAKLTPAQRSEIASYAVQVRWGKRTKMPNAKCMEKPLKNEEDEYKWSKEMVEAIKTRNFAAIDMDALLDEMESIVSRLERSLEYTVSEILEALLWEKYTNATKEEIDDLLIPAQLLLVSMLDSTPSLRDLLPKIMNEAYRRASELVNDSDVVTLPDECPFPMELVTKHPYDRLVAEGRFA